MANLNTTCGNEGRLRQYHAWGVEPRVSVHHRAFGVASETEFGVRAHFERQDRLQENGDTPTARSGVLVESNLRTNDGVLDLRRRTDSCSAAGPSRPGVRVEHVRFERTNRLANAGAGVTGDTAPDARHSGHRRVAHDRRAGHRCSRGVHRGFAPPRTEDVISNTGGVIDLDPELSWNYEPGFRSTLRPGVRLDATLFRMDYENQIVPASLAGGVGATLTNGGATLHQGLELRAQVDSAPHYRIRAQRVPARRLHVPAGRGIHRRAVQQHPRLRQRQRHRQPAAVRAGADRCRRAWLCAKRAFDVRLEAVRTSDQFGDDLNTDRRRRTASGA